MQRIAVWNTAFLGDAVLTLPLLQTLKEAFPQAEIDFYVRRGHEALFAAHPAVHRVYEFDRRRGVINSLCGMGKAIAQRGYDLWIGAHPSLRAAVLGQLSGARIRVGYTGGWRDAGVLRELFYTKCVNRRFGELDEIERLLELLNPVLPADIPRQTWPELYLFEAAIEKACSFREGLQGRLLGIHPGSVWGTKRWTPAGFAEIARCAVEKDVDVLLFAGPGEESMAAEVLHLSGLEGHSRLHNMSNALTLPELAAFLGILDCYLTNDSGPMHLAWVQHTPVVALFGPTVRQWGFYPCGEDSVVHEVPLSCRPCGLHGPQVCPQGHHNCMKLIDTAAVWKDVADRLGVESLFFSTCSAVDRCW